MKITVIGAGRIGRGYLTYLLLLNKCEITYFDMNKVVDELSRQGSYEIHVLGDASKNMVHDSYRAHYLSDEKALVNSMLESDFLFTSVGGKNMKSVGETIGKALKGILKTEHILNIVTCENWVDPAKDLRLGIESQLNEEEIQKLNRNVGISESVIVATGTGSPDGKEPINPMDTWIQDIRYLPVDSGRLKGKLPEWEGFEAVEHFGKLLTQKLYTNNTSCTAMSYIGLRYGYVNLCDACNDPYLETILDELYREINIALIDGMHIDRESQLAFSRRAKQKYTDRNIIDPMTRIARDPIRKLKPQDRFIMPARLALKAGYRPWAIARGAAAALFYYQEGDDSAGQLKELREKYGIEYILKNICELDENEELYGLILEQVDWLKKEGLVTDEV